MESFWEGKNVLVTGGAGFLGSYVVDRLLSRGVPKHKISVPRSVEHDLTNMDACMAVTQDVDIIIHLAAMVGGIGFNRDHPVELFEDNILMGVQMMKAARLQGVEKFIAVGTICAYPKITPVPFREENLWDGYPEETNAPYGLAKKMLLVQSQANRDQYGLNSVYLLPVNLYGPGDNFDPESSHVVPALIKKFYEAKQQNLPHVTVWGTGTPTREFLYAQDAAHGIVLAAERYNSGEPVNLGSGREISISDLAHMISRKMSYSGGIIFDRSQPDGQPRRALDVSRAKAFGFEATTDFETGLARTIEWYINSR